MFNNIVVDVVIAMALIFLVFSLITSGLRELISRVMETRAKEMWRTIRRLADDPILSDLREIRTVASSRDEDQRVEWLERTDVAESILRRHIASGDTGPEWKSTVTTALAPLRDVAGGDAALLAAIGRCEKRLLLEHASARPRWNGARRATLRGGERPVAPSLPQTPDVQSLAIDILNRSRTLTDAIYEHPLVRQLDRTWPGFHSRMSTLSKEDFSEAVTDLLGTVGIEEAVRTSFAPIARAIERYDLTDAQKARLWEPLQTALDGVRNKLHAPEPDLEDVLAVLDAIPDGVAQSVDAVRQALPDPGKTFGELAELAEKTRRSLSLEQREPLDFVRIGAAALAGSAPVGQIVDRLAERVRHTAAGAFSRMEDLRSEVGNWYDSRMDNLTEWYRRRSRIVAFGLGLLVVLAFNLDAVGLSTELWRNESVRDVVVAVADQSAAAIGECAGLAEGAAAAASSRECVDAEVDRLVAIGLPIGWDFGTACDEGCAGWGAKLSFASGTGGRGLDGLFAKLLGWILAAAALAMGASFWYDVLTRATAVKKRS